MSYEFLVSLRYLRAKRKSTFVSIITFISTAGVALGVMALIVVLAVMTGFEEDLKEKILGTNAHVVVLKAGGEIDRHGEIQEQLRRIPGVVAGTPFVYSQVMLSTGSHVSGVVLRGIEPHSDARVTNLGKSLVEGKLADLAATGAPGGGQGALPGLILGSELAKNLNLQIGDSLNVVSPLGTMTPFGMVPKLKRFRVAGLFNTGMYEYDSTLAYVGLAAAQEFLSLGTAVTGIQLRVADVYRADAIARTINERLGGDYFARDWMSMNKNILFALKTEKIVMFIILTLIVLVAAFGIASTLFMVVMEKTKDIAILKSMGATGASIMKIFVLEGLIIGCAGTVLGVAGGLLLANNLGALVELIKRLTGFELFSRDIYYLDHFPSQVVAGDVYIISLTAIVISFAATLYPSWQGSRLPPAEALRYE